MDQHQLCQRVLSARDEVVRVKQRRGTCGCGGACTSCADSTSVARDDLQDALRELDRLHDGPRSARD